MSDADKRAAWADFWAAEFGGHGGCLAGAGDELGAAQALAWRELANELPKGSRVLDLGTGDGVVLHQIAKFRPDLKLTGIDSAPSLPAQKGKIRLQPGIAMEQLPFAADSFEAIVSQFGYEYGPTAMAAREVGRVLKAGGRFRFLVHHRAGPIVRHNRARASALRWAVVESGQFAKARSLAESRRLLTLATPPAFNAAVTDAAQRFPGQSVAAEVMQALVQSLDPRRGAEGSLAAISEIERKARGELLRLEALADAARDEDGARAILNELSEAGLKTDEPRTIANRSGEPFAWILSGLA